MAQKLAESWAVSTVAWLAVPKERGSAETMVAATAAWKVASMADLMVAH